MPVPALISLTRALLTDPLLARLPSLSSRQRIGHFVRALPAGYTESVALDRNLIENDKIQGQYEWLRLITRGELTDTDRLKRIVSMNLSLFDKDRRSNAPEHRYPISLNETVHFKKDSKGSFLLSEGASQELFTNGWLRPENWGVWATGSIARLSLPIPIAEHPKFLKLNVQMLVPTEKGYQTIEIYKVIGGSAAHGFFRFHNGTTELVDILNIARSDSSPLSGAEITVPIENFMIGEGNISIEFRFPTPIRPKDIHLNSDDRSLGMGLISAVFR